MPAQLIEWEAPRTYRVAFSTRQGGVSAGDFRSLNIGLSTDDEAGRVFENRRRLADVSAPTPIARPWPGSATVPW